MKNIYSTILPTETAVTMVQTSDISNKSKYEEIILLLMLSTSNRLLEKL